MATPDEQQSTVPDQPTETLARAGSASLGVDGRKTRRRRERDRCPKEQLKDQQLRNLAEMENLRKRNAQEIANARDFAAKDFAFSLLAVKDTLEMVLKDQQSTTEQIKMGVDMTSRTWSAPSTAPRSKR